MTNRNYNILFCILQILTVVFLVIINVIEKNNFLIGPFMTILILFLFIIQLLLFTFLKRYKIRILPLLVFSLLVFFLEIYFMYVFSFKAT